MFCQKQEQLRIFSKFSKYTDAQTTKFRMKASRESTALRSFGFLTINEVSLSWFVAVHVLGYINELVCLRMCLVTNILSCNVLITAS